MTRLTRKKKFSNNQVVVFRFGDRNLVGKVIFIRPVEKQFIYDVLCEDGKVYSELSVDSAVKLTIDTNLTKMFYKSHGMDLNNIPNLELEDDEDDVPTLNPFGFNQPPAIDEIYDDEEIHDDDYEAPTEGCPDYDSDDEDDLY